MRQLDVEEKAGCLWRRLISSEDEFKRVYAEAIMPEIDRRIDELARRITLLDAPAGGDIRWKPYAEGTGLFHTFDTRATDCAQLFTPRWPVNENAFAWWKGMFTGEYFFRPEESPEAAYRFEERDGAFTVDAGPTYNNWVYLPSKATYPTTYALEFDYTVWQEMRETLQLCFSFDSLASRLRFVLGYNKKLGFEAVQNGMFLSAYGRDRLWDRLSRPCSLELGKPARVRLEVIENVFQLFFDGKLAMAARVDGHVPHPAHWVIIAWNGFTSDPMKLKIENLRVFVRDDA